MLKTLIYHPPEYRDLAHKIRENYIEHHHGEVDLISETDQNDIEYARKAERLLMIAKAVMCQALSSCPDSAIGSGRRSRPTHM